ncbi:MAG: SET domain-containing protein [Caldilineaceae bacterium]
MLSIQSVAGKGRGVFAQEFIRQGEIFECAAVIVLPAMQWGYVERTELFNYCYAWGEDSALALGYGSLFNHSYQPNAVYVKQFDAQRIDYMALRDIAPGEEITINYNSDPADLDPLWFAVVEA